MAMSVSEIANGAADYLEQHGHCKFELVNSSGAACFLGAKNIVAFGQESGIYFGAHENRVNATRVVAFSEQYLGIHDIVEWNNAPERTPDEVIQVLRDVAIKYQTVETTGG